MGKSWETEGGAVGTMLAAGDSTVALRRWRQEALILSEAEAVRHPGAFRAERKHLYTRFVEPLAVQRTPTDHTVNVITVPVTI